MKRILHIFEHLNNAGTETVILNFYKNIDRNKIQFDFCVYNDGTIENKFKDMGAQIYKIKTTKKFEFYFKLFNLLKEKKYDTVHIHMCDMMYVSVLAAKINRVKNIIVHAHCAGSNKEKLKKLKRKILDFCIFSQATNYFACSQAAAEYLFPINNKKNRIIYNGIDVNKFRYNERIRFEKRKEFGFKEDDNIIINVGRLEMIKNQQKIIDIAKIDKNEKNKYIIVGDGTLKSQILLQIKELGLDNKVILLENRDDISELLCMSDLFLFTSIYEGLGIVLIESQASGLKILASEGVPDEADLKTNLLFLKDLKEKEDVWLNKINELLDIKIDRVSCNDKIKNGNYNILNTAKELEKFYLMEEN